MLAEELGDDWKEKFVVWDCCWGTGNLTRDYRFKELYASTLEPSELAIGTTYNREAQKFVFDFLNDEIEDIFGVHVPEGLLQALKEDKPILFFINPPYAGTGSGAGKVKEKGSVISAINLEMNKQRIGACSQNLYAQFIYRILLIKQQFSLSNIILGLFSPTLYLTGSSWAIFRKKLFSNLSFHTACTFKASYFADVADTWGISFSIWKTGETSNVHSFDHKLVDLINENVQITGEKTIYNLDTLQNASAWVRLKESSNDKVDFPNVSSAIIVRSKENSSVKWHKDSIGYFYNKSNNVDKNPIDVALFTMPFFDAHGLSVLKDNFHKCTTLFSARKLISKNWINSKDEYLAPNESHEKWEEFVNDSIIYSLFHTSSNQSSLRDVEYKGKTWQIYNEFFFMAKLEIMDLAEKYKLYETYEEARTDKERYVYELLSQKTLSPEAQAVWDKACDITRKTFEYRELFNEEHPEYQILNWDCGWYQIKALAKQYAKTDMDAFDTLYKALADKMRPMVYELGFLK